MAEQWTDYITKLAGKEAVPSYLANHLKYYYSRTLELEKELEAAKTKACIKNACAWRARSKTDPTFVKEK